MNVILRVPALFIAEAWFRTDPTTVHIPYPTGKGLGTDSTKEFFTHFAYYSALLYIMALMVLPLKKLVTLYMYAVSGTLLAAAHYLSYIYVTTEESLTPHKDSVMEDPESICRLGIHMAMQGIISAVIAYLIHLQLRAKIILLVYTLPMLARVANYPVNDLHRVHNFATVFTILIVVFYMFNYLHVVLDLVKAGISKAMIAVNMYGWIPFLVAMWFSVLLPVQFLIFWSLLFSAQLYNYMGTDNHPILPDGWAVVILASIAECCITPVSLMGLCVTVSYVSDAVLTLTKLYLQGRAAWMNDSAMHRGWTEGFTMFLLSVQTGLLELKPPERAFLMSIVLFIVTSSLIQSMYEITEPILLALGASQNRSVVKHIRTIVFCSALWIFPLYMTHAIRQFFELDFWLLVVISSCLLTSVQVLGSLIVYALFIYDSVRRTPWDRLDDMVYFAKATTRVLEFVVAVFVVCYGLKESIQGDWSWLNSFILIVHCYFNVWQRLQAGWKSYLLRREAIKRIRSLPMATVAELQSHNDVCAICFQEMSSNACVTPCQHYFHAACLRKWFYVQDNCPLCHYRISVVTPGTVASPGGDGDPAVVPPMGDGGGDNVHDAYGN